MRSSSAGLLTAVSFIDDLGQFFEPTGEASRESIVGQKRLADYKANLEGNPE